MPYAPWNAGGYYPFSIPANTPIQGGNFGTVGNPGPTSNYTPASSLANYNINPGYQSGQGAYGQVPGPIGIPPSTYQQATTTLPGLGQAGTLATNSILSELQGDISPQALRNIQDAAAQFGVSSGMPGSNAMANTLASNKALLGNYRTTEQLQQQGLQNYANILGAVGQQQTNPALAAEIAAHNAQLGAAPNPQAAAQQQLANYFASLAATRGLGLRGAGAGPGYSPAGGTGVYAPQQSALGFGFNTFGQQVPTPQPYTGGYGGFAPDTLYPGTELAGQPNLSSLLGPVNQNYAPSAGTGYYDPGPTGYYDTSAANPDYWSLSQNDFGLSPQDYLDYATTDFGLGG